MNLLSIWCSGGVTEMLLGFAVLVSGIFWYQAWKASKSGSTQQTQSGIINSKENISIFKLPTFWLGVAVWVLILLGILFIVAPDYKGVTC